MTMSTTDWSAANQGARIRWRTPLMCLAIAMLCGTLAGCSAGQNAETARETPDTRGVDGAVGPLVLNDVYLATAETVPAGGSVPLRVALTDDSAQPDRLVAVTTPVAGSVELLQPDGTPAPDGITVPGEGQVDATNGPVLVRLSGLTRALSPQAVVPVTFDFVNAGRVTLDDVPASPPARGQG